jgi:CheY-like chemotaxis protein
MPESAGMGEYEMPKRNAVLVVEDEPLLLIDVLDLVEDAGFVGYGAKNAALAIQCLEKNADVGVLFTDIQMRGSMDGLMLARTVRERWPHIRIIVTSGHVRPTKEDMPAESVFFAKPYPPATVTRLFGEMMESSSA